MHELTIEEFTRFVVRQMEDIENTILNNPDNNETFPLIVVNNPMQAIKKTENNIPIYTRFSINIESWSNSKYEVMKIYHEINKKIRKYNFIQIGSQIDIFDDLTQKYRYGGRYEVNYNGLTNSFEIIK